MGVGVGEGSRCHLKFVILKGRLLQFLNAKAMLSSVQGAERPPQGCGSRIGH